MTVPTLEDLLAALAADGSVQKVAHDTVLVHEYLGRRFDPPFR